MNLVPCALREAGGTLTLDFDGAGAIDLSGDHDLLRRARSAREPRLYFGARPEDMELAAADVRNGLKARVTFVEPVGPRTIVHLEIGGQAVKVAKEKRFPCASARR
jgi:hypothetical protein